MRQLLHMLLDMVQLLLGIFQLLFQLTKVATGLLYLLLSGACLLLQLLRFILGITHQYIHLIQKT